MSASELASIFQIAPPPTTPAKRVGKGLKKLAKVSFVLLFVMGAACFGALYFKPEWREIALDRADPIWTKTKSVWAQALAKAGYGPTTQKTEPVLVNGLPPVTPIQLQSAPKPLIEPQARPEVATKTAPTPLKKDAPKITLSPKADRESDPASDALTQSVWASPATGTADPAGPRPSTSVVDLTPPSLSTPPLPTPQPPTSVEIDALAGQASFYVPTTRPAFVRSPSLVPTPTIVSSPSKELSIDDAIKQATELRTSALDAEARRDWKGALAVWEQIATLPEPARPSDLKVRLQLARERLAGN